MILKKPEFKGISPLTLPWSKIDDYEAYMKFQNDVRGKFDGCAPLAVEFVIWRSQNMLLTD